MRGGGPGLPEELTRDPEAGLLALQVALEVVGVALAASVVEDLALLRHGVVEVALDARPARTLVHLEQTGTWESKRPVKSLGSAESPSDGRAQGESPRKNPEVAPRTQSDFTFGCQRDAAGEEGEEREEGEQARVHHPKLFASKAKRMRSVYFK